MKAIDKKSIELPQAQFSGTSRALAYLRGDASEHSGAKARIPKSRCPSIHGRRQAMTKLKIFSAAGILSLMFATPVFAQAAIQEPGLFAFYYPNNHVLNGGRPTPAAGLNPQMPVLLGSNPYSTIDSSAGAASCAGRYRSYDPASGT